MLKEQFFHALTANLNCNRARLKCLVLLVTAVIRHRTVNLAILSTTDDGKCCSNESRYRRFQDFFLRFALCLPSVSKLILQRLPKPPCGYLLAIDRTNWQFGRKDINFLVIAIVVGNVSIPLVWKVLPERTKGGNSNVSQRIDLMEQLLKHLDPGEIHALTMDREFTGKRWLQWLDQNEIAYVLRIKSNTVVGKHLAREHAASSRRNLKSKRKVFGFGLELFFACKSIRQGARSSHLMVVSNRFRDKEALALYRKRWGVERLFGHLKRKGFDLESTHLTDPAKLEKLFAVVVIAFLFSFAWGCHLRQTRKKSSAASTRKSLFRVGLEDILNLIGQRLHQPRDPRRISEFIRWLRQPQFASIFLV